METSHDFGFGSLGLRLGRGWVDLCKGLGPKHIPLCCSFRKELLFDIYYGRSQRFLHCWSKGRYSTLALNAQDYFSIRSLPQTIHPTP